MSTVNRLLNNIYKHNQLVSRKLNSVERKYGLFDSNSPIPNQIFDSEINKLNQSSCLFFSQSAYHNLYQIQLIMRQQAYLRRDNNWQDRPINFICTGYKDNDNNYYIDNVSLPIYNLVSEENLTETQKTLKIMSTNDKTLLSNAQLCATSDVYDYLRNPKPLTNTPYTSRVALLGFTRPFLSTDNINNCMKLGEMAKSTLPGDVAFTQPAISGTILLTQESLECAIIEYGKNQNNTVYPINIMNILRAEITNESGITQPIKISKSSQPLEGLPTPSFLGE